MVKEELYSYSDTVNELLARYGVRFGIYKNGTFKEQLFPFDMIPRKIGRDEFDYLERGLKQRVMALNEFIKDIYGDKKIIRDNVVPEEFVYMGSGYLVQCEGVRPPQDVFTHISGIDLVQAKDGEWYVLEDNLRIPSGACTRPGSTCSRSGRRRPSPRRPTWSRQRRPADPRARARWSERWAATIPAPAAAARSTRTAAAKRVNRFCRDNIRINSV